MRPQVRQDPPMDQTALRMRWHTHQEGQHIGLAQVLTRLHGANSRITAKPTRVQHCVCSPNQWRTKD